MKVTTTFEIHYKFENEMDLPMHYHQVEMVGVFNDGGTEKILIEHLEKSFNRKGVVVLNWKTVGIRGEGL